MKKTPREIIILHMCTINENHMMDMERDRHIFFLHWTIFFLFCLLNNLENQNFEKMKKTPADIIILHLCAINDNYMMYGS